MQVTFFFPEDTGLKPVSVIGVPPKKGGFVYFGTFELNAKDLPDYDAGYDYNRRNRWRVKRVDFGVRTSKKSIERVKHKNSYYAEVHLIPAVIKQKQGSESA